MSLQASSLAEVARAGYSQLRSGGLSERKAQSAARAGLPPPINFQPTGISQNARSRIGQIQGSGTALLQSLIDTTNATQTAITENVAQTAIQRALAELDAARSANAELNSSAGSTFDELV